MSPSSALLLLRCCALFAATAPPWEKKGVGWDACNVRVRIDVDMYKMYVAGEKGYCISGPAVSWAGSGPGQVTSQATRRALTCGSRADRPGTDVSGVRCQVPAAADAGLLLPARGRAFVRSFVPQVVEGGDTD